MTTQAHPKGLSVIFSVHVESQDSNTILVDFEGAYEGSGTVSADSPTISYTDSKGYEVTVTFTVKDGVAHVDMRIFGKLTIEDTAEYLTETVTLSGEK